MPPRERKQIEQYTDETVHRITARVRESKKALPRTAAAGKKKLKQKKAGARQKRKAAKASTAKETTEHQKLVQQVSEYMDEHHIGSKSAVKAFNKKKGFEGVTYNQVESYRRRLIEDPFGNKVLPEANLGTKILTDGEGDELVTWLIERNLSLDGKDRHGIEKKILVILAARQKARLLCAYRQGVHLSGYARRILRDQTVPREFFARFDARYSDRLSKKKKSKHDSKRARKATRDNSQKVEKSLYEECHFLPDENGKSLVGTMNPESGMLMRPIVDANGRFTEGPGNSRHVQWPRTAAAD
jgi:hypothetical protein